MFKDSCFVAIFDNKQNERFKLKAISKFWDWQNFLNNCWKIFYTKNGRQKTVATFNIFFLN